MEECTQQDRYAFLYLNYFPPQNDDYDDDYVLYQNVRFADYVKFEISETSVMQLHHHRVLPPTQLYTGKCRWGQQGRTVIAQPCIKELGGEVEAIDGMYYIRCCNQ